MLLIDQVFKYSGWSKELRYCYDNFEDLKIIFSGSSVMRLKEENPDLSGKVAVSYTHLDVYKRQTVYLCQSHFYALGFGRSSFV